MKKSELVQKDIRHYHEILDKDERPILGHRYLVTMNDEATYVADITDFKGGCWAKVKVVESANDKYAHLYTPEMEFEIKVAHYRFQEVNNSDS